MKIKQLKEYYAKKREQITIFSKHKGWITVSPESINRAEPFEKLKKYHNKLNPSWMDLTNIKNNKNEEDKFKSVAFFPHIKKNKKMMLLVDKNINKKLNKNKFRSIFSYQDFKHNVMLEEEKKYFDSLVDQKPRKFFDWDDGKIFNPKTKKDI